MFITSGDYVVCPGHGVGQVLTIEERPVGEKVDKFYVVKLISNGARVLAPVEGASEANNIRPLLRPEEVDSVFSILADKDVKIDRSTWNRRHRDYLQKINSGSLSEVADVLRQVLLIKISKKLSYGEKKIMDLCRELIVKEISLATGNQEDEISKRIDAIY